MPDMTTHKLRALIRKVTPLYSGFLKVNRYELDVERHEGGLRPLTWEVMERGHSVAALGYDPTLDVVVLVNELRPGALAAGDYPYTDSLVAGVVEPGENVMDAAVREMREEAGLELRDPIVVHAGAYVSPGGTSEKVAIVFGIVDASRAGGVHGKPDEREDILAVVIPAQQFIDAARTGSITDMKTVLAAYWLAERRSR
jgi:ADP-ribose pyrophosphatase